MAPPVFQWQYGGSADGNAHTPQKPIKYKVFQNPVAVVAELPIYLAGEKSMYVNIDIKYKVQRLLRIYRKLLCTATTTINMAGSLSFQGFPRIWKRHCGCHPTATIAVGAATKNVTSPAGLSPSYCLRPAAEKGRGTHGETKIPDGLELPGKLRQQHP